MTLSAWLHLCKFSLWKAFSQYHTIVRQSWRCLILSGVQQKILLVEMHCSSGYLRIEREDKIAQQGVGQTIMNAEKMYMKYRCIMCMSWQDLKVMAWKAAWALHLQLTWTHIYQSPPHKLLPEAPRSYWPHCSQSLATLHLNHRPTSCWSLAFVSSLLPVLLHHHSPVSSHGIAPSQWSATNLCIAPS